MEDYTEAQKKSLESHRKFINEVSSNELESMMSKFDSINLTPMQELFFKSKLLRLTFPNGLMYKFLEMEKQQIINAYMESPFANKSKQEAEEYYNSLIKPSNKEHMTKQEIQSRVSKNGQPLPLDKFSWDAETKTFSSSESGLVLDFKGINGCTFDTASGCTFDTSWSCTFKTGSGCTFVDILDDCVLVRRDIFEFYELPKGKSIKLNGNRIKGYTKIEETKTITIDGKEIKISDKVKI